MKPISAIKKHKPHTIHCPLCDGTGRAPDLGRFDIDGIREERKEKVLAMRAAGYSYRKIAELTGYSVRLVWLDANDKD